MSKKPGNNATRKGASASGPSAKGNAATPRRGKGSSANALSTPAKVVIIIFAVLMVVSLMMPTLSTAFSNSQQAEQGNSQDASSDGGSGSDSSSNSSDASSADASPTTGVAAVDAKYQGTVSELESKLASDGTNLATLLNLGRNYMRWGASVRAASSAEDDVAHGNDLLEKAIGYYERYLGLKDSDAVRVDIALCKLYEGETSEAQSDLETLTQNSPTYAPAWANLGMIQEYSGNADAAKASYQAAIDSDPNDEYGAKSYATQRIAALESSSSSAAPSSPATSTTPSSSGETGAKGLTDTLNNLSGTGL
ncbi:MAG: tetratricopeptide repeat protein [Coriobacteriaceae bacterium]|nr:tetratricopeptide repeat protein [Coriobacteriaceae bacterium]MCI6844748.1 tetratricopeptide repeat protein [Coriobacteriaceae bacterium]